MNTTAHLGLPYMAASQAQKHVTYNEALRGLDALVQLSVQDRDLGDPPPAPEDGARYIIPASATGAWADRAGQVAAWQDGAWAFYPPVEGWLAWLVDEQRILAFDGTTWIALDAASADIEVLEQLGINTAADATNRLAVKADATLFSHDDVTPGSGDHRLKLNKSSVASTASALFQSDWSGRAEIGLTGDDNLHVKVSADGANWTDALRIEAATGAVRLPATVVETQPMNLLKDGGRFSGSPEPASFAASSFVAPDYLTPYNGAAFASGPRYTANSSTYGGPNDALDPDIEAFMAKLKDPGNARRYSVEFFVLQVTAGSGTLTAPVSVDGVDHYRAVENAYSPVPSHFTLNFHVLVKSGSVALTRVPQNETLFIDGDVVAASPSISSDQGWRQVTRRYAFDPRDYGGYSQVLIGLHATPGSVFYIAAPFLSPGHTPSRSGLLYGLIPGLEAWR